jgi:hypothetical protein
MVVRFELPGRGRDPAPARGRERSSVASGSTSRERSLPQSRTTASEARSSESVVAPGGATSPPAPRDRLRSIVFDSMSLPFGLLTLTGRRRIKAGSGSRDPGRDRPGRVQESARPVPAAARAVVDRGFRRSARDPGRSDGQGLRRRRRARAPSRRRSEPTPPRRTRIPRAVPSRDNRSDRDRARSGTCP